MKTTKKMQSFRLNRDQLEHLKEMSIILECTQTSMVEEALDFYFLMLEGIH